MKFSIRHAENPVVIVRTKRGWVVKNECDEELSRPLLSHQHAVAWCRRNYCAPVRSFGLNMALKYVADEVWGKEEA